MKHIIAGFIIVFAFVAVLVLFKTIFFQFNEVVFWISVVYLSILTGVISYVKTDK